VVTFLQHQSQKPFFLIYSRTLICFKLKNLQKSLNFKLHCVQELQLSNFIGKLRPHVESVESVVWRSNYAHGNPGIWFSRTCVVVLLPWSGGTLRFLAAPPSGATARIAQASPVSLQINRYALVVHESVQKVATKLARYCFL